MKKKSEKQSSMIIMSISAKANKNRGIRVLVKYVMMCMNDIGLKEKKIWGKKLIFSQIFIC